VEVDCNSWNNAALSLASNASSSWKDSSVSSVKI
jgi:hypothetical protein